MGSPACSAKAVAALNHPNICTLYDVGENYIVMELVEGPTLAERIKEEAIPLDEVLGIARQIADALEAAHEKGITHRDLKPANVKIRPDGMVKVLDFGLAKIAEPAPQVGSRPENSPTLTLEAATRLGVVMGTAGYMPPEQAKGKEVDKRADIWAFGVVLYEMVTGKRLFHGDDLTEILASVVKEQPDYSAAPSKVRRLLSRCLEKDPKKRLRDIGDAWELLEEAPVVATAPAPSRSRFGWVGWAVAAVSLCVALALAAIRFREAPPEAAAFHVTPPAGTSFAPSINTGGSAISPDGRTLAFVARPEEGEPLLYVRPLETLEARALPGIEDAGRPFWSPDSKSLAFVAKGKLKRIDLAGGAPVNLCDASRGRGGDWNEEGVILFGDFQAEGIQRIAASGGAPSLVTKVNKEAGELYHYYPQFLHGGKKFLYAVRHNEPAKHGIAIGSLDAQPGASAIIAATEYKALYEEATGRLLYIQGEATLMARRLELDPPRLTGDPVTVAEDVSGAATNGYADFSLSRNGTLFHGQASAVRNLRFVWRDRAGKVLETIREPVQGSGSFALSPHGVRAAYAAGPRPSQSDIWVMELGRGLSTRISFNKGYSPHWSPDGKHLYYNRSDVIIRKPADGTGEETVLAKAEPNDFLSGISPDGKVLLFGNRDILALPLAGGGKAEPWLKTPQWEYTARFSPDGRWVAYASDESGRTEIYIQGYPEKRGKWLVSGSGGRFPVWRADGKELFWSGSNGDLMAAGIELLADSVRPGSPEVLFRTRSSFQPSRDGRRFLVWEQEGEAGQKPMVVVENWAARLGR